MACRDQGVGEIYLVAVQSFFERANPKGFGFDAAVGEITDLVKAGVIDPAKVTKNALLNASSIAGLLLTTEALVCEIPEEKKDAPMPGGGTGDMGGM